MAYAHCPAEGPVDPKDIIIATGLRSHPLPAIVETACRWLRQPEHFLRATYLSLIKSVRLCTGVADKIYDREN
jgi:hypothetical protein